MLFTFNNCNIIQLTNKNTSNEDFDNIHKVFLDDISDNMTSLTNTGKYGAINKAYPTTMIYYVVKYMDEYFTLQEDITTDRQISKIGELALIYYYLRIMNYKTNCYWEHK